MELSPAFIQQMTETLGSEETARLTAALGEPSPVSLRLHPLKAGADAAAALRRVPWAATGRYLEERPSFTADPLFHAGCYYVQEAASMFVEQAFRAFGFRPQRLLDLCAAPGGKSTHWRALLDDDALLVANEPVPLRTSILAENLAKWGHPATIVTQSYPKAFGTLTEAFDVIAADVPCSGEGMFRKDEGAIADWSPQAVEMCAERQRQIISDVWNALRPGGFLVYSTCTFNRAENEDNVRFIADELGADILPLPLQEEWGAVATAEGVHFYPHRAEGEGFFLALLRKHENDGTSARDRRPSKGERIKRVRPQNVTKWLNDADAYAFFTPDTDLLAAIPEVHFAFLERLAKAAHIVRAGVLMAQQKGNKLIPQPELALSTALAREAFPHVELTYAEAMAYLRREALTLPAETSRGYVIATFGGHPLGFLNQLGNRANNLYPSEWRVRTQISSDRPSPIA